MNASTPTVASSEARTGYSSSSTQPSLARLTTYLPYPLSVTSDDSKGLDSTRTRHGVVVIVLDVAMDLLQHLDALSDVCGRWRKPTSEILVSGVCLESETKENRAGGETEASNVLVFDHGNQDLVPRIEALASHRASTPNKLFLTLDLCIAHRLQHRSCKRRSLVKWAKAGQQRMRMRIRTRKCVAHVSEEGPDSIEPRPTTN